MIAWCLVEQGKGHKDRYVPLTPSLLYALRIYWRDYKPNDILFYSTSRKRLWISLVCKLPAPSAKWGFVSRVAGSLRHAFAASAWGRLARSYLTAMDGAQGFTDHHALHSLGAWLSSRSNQIRDSTPVQVLWDVHNGAGPKSIWGCLRCSVPWQQSTSKW